MWGNDFSTHGFRLSFYLILVAIFFALVNAPGNMIWLPFWGSLFALVITELYLFDSKVAGPADDQ